MAKDLTEGSLAGTGARGVDLGDSAYDGSTGDVRCERMADDRFGRSPAGSGRNVYFHGKRLSLQCRIAPAGIAAHRSILDRSAGEYDVGENLVRRKSAG